MSTRPRIAIVGAGPAGIGAALRLIELGYDNWTLIDADSSGGGLCQTICDSEGWKWDLGGHVIFSKSTWYNEMIQSLYNGADEAEASMPRQLLKHRRRCIIICGEPEDSTIARYPIQLHIHEMPKSQQLDCFLGIVEAQLKAAELRGAKGKEGALNEMTTQESFHDWAHRMFGKGLVDHFVRPYNQKVWAWPLEDMGSRWLGDRVAPVEIKAALTAMFKETGADGWGPNSHFFYPSRGSGDLWNALASYLPPSKLKLGTRLTSIDAGSKKLHFESGETMPYDVLLSTLNIRDLFLKSVFQNYQRIAESINLSPEQIFEAATQLKNNTTEFVGIAIKGQIPEKIRDKMHWGYFSSGNQLCYRIVLLSELSPGMVPEESRKDCYSFLFEYAWSTWRQKPYKQGGEDEVKEAEKFLVAYAEKTINDYGLKDPDAPIVRRWFARVNNGYPIPTLKRDESVEILHRVLAQADIFSRGRFGGWKYEVGNSDHSCLQGAEWVDSLLRSRKLGEGWMGEFAEEPTYLRQENDPAAPHLHIKFDKETFMKNRETMLASES